jgi:L-rhamnose mutarotase
MWPDLREAITTQGGCNFTIYAAPSIDCVFGVVDVGSIAEWNAGASSELTREWWRYMSEVMPTNPDYSPVEIPLATVFHQP